MLACFEKGLEVEIVNVNVADDSQCDEINQLTPWGRVPILVTDSGTVVCESSIIVEHLEAVYPQPPLLPKDPHEAVDVRYLDRVTDSYISTPLAKLFHYRLGLHHPSSAASVAASQSLLQEALEWLNCTLEGKFYVVGSEFSLADCSVITALKHADTLAMLTSYDVLAHYLSNMRKRSAVRLFEEMIDAQLHHPVYEGLSSQWP